MFAKESGFSVHVSLGRVPWQRVPERYWKLSESEEQPADVVSSHFALACA